MAEAAKRSALGELTKGFVKENPVLRLVLGTCPTLAITTSVENAIGMGVAATLVLIMSNIVISALRKVIPSKVRVPCFIVVIAAFVSMIQLLVKAFAPGLDAALGIYLPLIVVNCIILGRAEAFASKNPGRAEAFASKNPIGLSALDGIGMGIGFTVALTLMAAIREFFGSGNLTLKVLGFGTTLTDIFGLGDSNVLSAIHLEPIIIFILAPGGFFVFGLLVALVNKLSSRKGGDPAELNCCNVTEDADGNLVLVADGKTIVMPKVDTTPQVKKVEKSGKEAAEA